MMNMNTNREYKQSDIIDISFLIEKAKRDSLKFVWRANFPYQKIGNKQIVRIATFKDFVKYISPLTRK